MTTQDTTPIIETGVLEGRRRQVMKAEDTAIVCEKPSLAGSVSQRACTFCGSRVVLYPIADALHLVHGPIGCAAYTWDIRGSLSSGPNLHRMSFSTDLREHEVIHGGAKKLEKSLRELIYQHEPKAAFVYSTCIAGLIGDDIDAVCRQVQNDVNIPIINVASEGFKGSKKDGYKAACYALERLIGTLPVTPNARPTINILGDFNIAGEFWIIKRYFEEMGVDIRAGITGDGRVDDIARAHGADLNIVQCSGSMMGLAQTMQQKYNIPFLRVSFFGMEDTAQALYDVAQFFENSEIMTRTRNLVRREIETIRPELNRIKERLQGKNAAVYVGGSFKAISLIRALRQIGIETVVVGSQTGNAEEYALIKGMCTPETIIVDDSNPVELAHFCREKKTELFIGGVKERPMAYKLGMAFCDHNHERKTALSGFTGMLNFAHEVELSMLSPVWKFTLHARRES